MGGRVEFDRGGLPVLVVLQTPGPLGPTRPVSFPSLRTTRHPGTYLCRDWDYLPMSCRTVSCFQTRTPRVFGPKDTSDGGHDLRTGRVTREANEL